MDIFEEEKEYFISFIPNYYSDPETKKVNPTHKDDWLVLLKGVLVSVFHRPFLPDNPKEELVAKAKEELIRRINHRYKVNTKPVTIGEETEPAE